RSRPSRSTKPEYVATGVPCDMSGIVRSDAAVYPRGSAAHTNGFGLSSSPQRGGISLEVVSDCFRPLAPRICCAMHQRIRECRSTAIPIQRRDLREVATQLHSQPGPD